MSLLSCPTCRGRIPAAAINCVHCGALAPACADCTGAGTCPACAAVGSAPDGCDRCSGTGHCPACQGRKRRWPDPAPQASP